MRGFSTLELLIALTLGALMIGAVVQVAFGAQYWLAASETSGEALSHAKAALEEARAAARRDFAHASSSPEAKVADESCSAGGLCYYRSVLIEDISPCAKEVSVEVAWQVAARATTSVSLQSALASPNEIVRLGGDCSVASPEGEWTSIDSRTVGTTGGTLQGLDVLDGVTYAVTDAPPYLSIIENGAPVIFLNGFTEEAPLTAIDVARDTATGRVYAYVGRSAPSGGFGIIDVTDSANPVPVTAPLALPGATLPPVRIYAYGGYAYLGTREGGTEFFVVRVDAPETPVVEDSYDLNTSVYGIAVRNQELGGILTRLVYLATPQDAGEVRVLEAPAQGEVREVTEARTDLPGNKDGRSLFLSGTRLYVGLESGAGPDLYALDASVPFVSGLPVLDSAETSPRTPVALRVSGARAFVAGLSSAPEFSVRDAFSLSTVHATQGISNLRENALDLEDAALYLGAGSSVRALTSP